MRKITSMLTLVLFLASTMAMAQSQNAAGLANQAKKQAESAAKKQMMLNATKVQLNDEAPNRVSLQSEATGDIIWDLDIQAITGDTQNLGAEFDGTYLWVTGANSAADPNKLYKIDPVAGTLEATYDQPASATDWGIRDLAWVEADGLLYGGASSFYSFDPATETWTTLFSGTFGVIRALAFDGTNFWTKSFGDPLYEFDVNGNVINTYNPSVAAAAYGAAYDDNEGFLYLFSQDDAMLYQFGLDGVHTGVTYDVSGYQVDAIAGGAFFDFGNLVPGFATIGVVYQGEPDAVGAMELYPSVVYNNDVGVQTISSPNSGVDLTDSEPVMFTIKNYGTNPQSDIDWEITWDGPTGAGSASGTYAGPLAAGETVEIDAGTADLSVYGDYTFEACTYLTGDEFEDNDCANKMVSNEMPSYCDATTVYEDEFIANVLCGNIDNSSDWQGGVADYTDISTVIPAGMEEDIVISNGNAWSSDKVTCWVDWNMDYDFGVGTDEEFILTSVGGNGETFEGQIAVPAGTPEGEYRMRIRMTYSSDPVPCGESNYGEVEDYTIVVGEGLATDVGIKSIDMGALIQPGTITPMATVKNYGSETQTFDVTLTIDGYASTMTVSDLAAGETEQVSFDDWDATIGTYTAEACTELAGDENPDNDCMSMDVSVQEMTAVYGYNAYDPSGALEEGPVWFDLGNPMNIELIAPTTSSEFIAGACWANDTWYGVEYETGNVYTIDPETGAMTMISSTGINLAGLAYDDASDTFYAVGGEGNFYEVDPVSGDATLIGAHGAGMTIISLTSDGNGGLYGHTVSFDTDDKLFQFDPATGAATEIGSLGMSLLYAQDASFDKESGVLYLAAYLEAGTSGLYTCDVNTAATTLIGGFQGDAEIDGFAIPGGGMGPVTQTIELPAGYKFASTNLEMDDPDMLTIVDPILGDNLDFIRNSNGAQLKKIGPNWVNNIGDWMTTEGYLFKMTGAESLTIEGMAMDPTTPINIAAGYSFVSYLHDMPMNAMDAFESIVNDDLDFIRASDGTQIKKIGPNWVNGIGNAVPTEGYLVKSAAAQELIYPVAVKAGVVGQSAKPSFFEFEGGNPAEEVYTLYIDSDLQAGDEVAAFDGNKMVGSMVIASENKFDNDLPIFSELVSGKGYQAGNAVTLKVYDRSENTVSVLNYTMVSEYDARTASTYPQGDGEFGIAKVEKSAGMSDLATKVALFPNPANDVITIQSPEAINSLRVYNYTGQLVVEREAMDANFQLNVENFESGIYIVEVETLSGTISKKVTVK